MIQSATVDFDLRDSRNVKLLDWGWKFRGERKYLVIPISFQPEFAGRRPHVLLSMTRVDTEINPSITFPLTYSLEPRNVSTAGFELALGLNSNDISSLQVSWLAISSDTEPANSDWQSTGVV